MFEIETKELKISEELKRKIYNCFNKTSNDNQHDLEICIIGKIIQDKKNIK